jgi:hypothetical protein
VIRRLAERMRRRHQAADAKAAAARQEVQVSRDRLERIRADVIQPLREAGEHNRFAEMIRQSLMEGHGR